MHHFNGDNLDDYEKWRSEYKPIYGVFGVRPECLEDYLEDGEEAVLTFIFSYEGNDSEETYSISGVACLRKKPEVLLKNLNLFINDYDFQRLKLYLEQRRERANARSALEAYIGKNSAFPGENDPLIDTQKKDRGISIWRKAFEYRSEGLDELYNLIEKYFFDKDGNPIYDKSAWPLKNSLVSARLKRRTLEEADTLITSGKRTGNAKK